LALAVAGTAGAAEVTPQRLLHAANEPSNWLLPFGSYDGHNNSRLSQINLSNVGEMRLLFLYATGGTAPSTVGGNPPNQQAVPAVDDGFMYVYNPWGQTMKVDVRSGKKGVQIWRHDAEVEKGGTMRGTVALLGNYVYTNTREQQLFKIDAASGETVWEMNTQTVGNEAKDRQSMQPMAVKNQVMIGNSAGGKRGYVKAFDADNGDLKWTFFTTAAPDQFGGETWADDWNAWASGGAGVWTQGSYDPETNLVLYGTGDAAPWHDPAFRPGDNLFTVAVVALDVDSGELAWYFQVVPNESFDFDDVNARMLYDIEIDGVLRKVQGNFARTGYYMTLDRTNGDFLIAGQFANVVNWTAGLDPKTGHPVEYNPDLLLQTYANNKTIVPGDPQTAQNMCPVFLGQPTLMPPHFDAERMRAYVVTRSGCWSQEYDAGGDGAVLPGAANERGYERADIWRGKSFSGRVTTYAGEGGRIDVVDVRTGQKVDSVDTKYAPYSGVLGTSSDLLFVGHLDGKFSAYDKDSLTELWSFNVGTPITAPAITYSVDGKQYVAVVIGGSHRFTEESPELGQVFRSANVAVFGL